MVDRRYVLAFGFTFVQNVVLARSLDPRRVRRVGGAGTLGLLASRVTKSLGIAPWREAPLSLLREDRGRILRFLVYSNLSGTARLVTGKADILIVG